MLEEMNTKGPDVAVAVFLSSPYLNQIGTRTIPAPTLNEAAAHPARKP